MSLNFGYLIVNPDAGTAADAATYARRVQGETHAVVTPGTGLCASSLCEADGIHIAVSGRPMLNGQGAVSGDDLLSIILQRYREAGSAVLAELEGAFSLAIVDPQRRKALLAVDRMGIERLTYTDRPAFLAFGMRAETVARFPGVGGELRLQALYDFLFMHMVPAPRTVYENVLKLPPASALHYDNGRSRLERYWTPKYTYADSADFEELKVSLREGLATAVRASGVDARTGAFLSGGLDSSSVAGTLAQITDGMAPTFTVGFGEADYDELRFARIANEHFGCRPFEYTMKPEDIVDAFPRIAAAFDEPFGNSSAAPTYFCAKLAADNGISHLLAGDGGDELFGGNERYVRHHIFETYFRLPHWLRRSVIEPATRAIAVESRVMPLRKLRSYVDQATIPLPDRFESWNFMYREGGPVMLDAEFSASVDKDGPMKEMRRVWEASPSDNLLETMLWYDWKFTLADNDLRKVGTMCELAGVRVSYPMLHPLIVDLSIRVPPRMKIRGLELRSFFKRAMGDFLPAKIIRKKKHGFGLPFGLWLKSDRVLGDMIYSNLHDLKKRHIIDAGFIDNLVSEHRQGHASYFGYAIWDLAMLEAWLAHHTDSS